MINLIVICRALVSILPPGYRVEGSFRPNDPLSLVADIIVIVPAPRIKIHLDVILSPHFFEDDWQKTQFKLAPTTQGFPLYCYKWEATLIEKLCAIQSLWKRPTAEPTPDLVTFDRHYYDVFLLADVVDEDILKNTYVRMLADGGRRLATLDASSPCWKPIEDRRGLYELSLDGVPKDSRPTLDQRCTQAKRIVLMLTTLSSGTVSPSLVPLHLHPSDAPASLRSSAPRSVQPISSTNAPSRALLPLRSLTPSHTPSSLNLALAPSSSHFSPLLIPLNPLPTDLPSSLRSYAPTSAPSPSSASAPPPPRTHSAHLPPSDSSDEVHFSRSRSSSRPSSQHPSATSSSSGASLDSPPLGADSRPLALVGSNSTFSNLDENWVRSRDSILAPPGRSSASSHAIGPATTSSSPSLASPPSTSQTHSSSPRFASTRFGTPSASLDVSPFASAPPSLRSNLPKSSRAARGSSPSGPTLAGFVRAICVLLIFVLYTLFDFVLYLVHKCNR